MYPKTKTWLLIKHYAPIFIKLLDIKIKKIKWRVYNIQSREFKEDKEFHDNAHYEDEMGLTIHDVKQGERIYIFNMVHVGQKDTIGTIFHELCHVKYHELSKRGKAINLEEDFIRAVEKCVVGLLLEGF